MSANTIENLSHALLTDRDSADQHPLGAITGLESALTTLTVDHHTVGRYAMDSKEACSSSVHHASIAVAEAAYIESILNNLKSFVGDLTEQEDRINELIAQAEAQISTIEASVQYVQNAERNVAQDAKDAALYAEVSQQVLTKLDTVPELLAAATEAKSVASSAATTAEKAAQAATTSAENIELYTQQINAQVEIAEEAAEKAELYADTLGETTEMAIEAANSAAQTARETMEAAHIIVDSVEGYKEACTNAEESADDAAAYATLAVDSAAKAEQQAKIVTDNVAIFQNAIDVLVPAVQTIDEKVAETAAYAEAARLSAEEARLAFAGAIRLLDPVETEEDLPADPVKGDMVRVEKTSTYYLWDGTEWQSFSSDLYWYASVDELPTEEEELQDLLDSLHDGAYISVIPGL